ncbi:MAG: hypothetical protein IKO36_03825 [Bacteroidaceae bacterium]|nr:hypothetical protein [Bacteroidaceae bacterium]
MCEITNGKIYIADKDIVCYKLIEKIEKNGRTKYRPAIFSNNFGNLGYVEGLLYSEDKFCVLDSTELKDVWIFNTFKKSWRHNILQYIDNNKVISRPYSPYTNKMYNFANSDSHLRVCDSSTDYCMSLYGFYSYTYYMNGKMEEDYDLYNHEYGVHVPAKFVIPKGSFYCVSDDGEVFISNRIKFICCI